MKIHFKQIWHAALRRGDEALNIFKNKIKMDIILFFPSQI